MRRGEWSGVEWRVQSKNTGGACACVRGCVGGDDDGD